MGSRQEVGTKNQKKTIQKCRVNVTALILILLLYTLVPGTALADRDKIRLKPRQVLRTAFTVIKYESDQDLALFHRAVRFGPPEWNRPAELGSLSTAQGRELLGKKVDAVFVRARDILDMKKRYAPVNITLCPDETSLEQAWKRQKKGRLTLRAWYRFDTNTIYLNVRDIHVGILAHQLALSIVNHFLAVRPPPNTARILAGYVDRHLNRGFVP